MSFSQLKSFPAGALAAAGLTAASIALWQYAAPARAGEYGAQVPAASTTLAQANASRIAVLAGGCFWGMEEVFQHVKGVSDVVSGYAGGTRAHANYRDSSTGQYGDAEAVRITYDPSEISYAQLLQIYFSVAHDPTQVDRQGPDVGPQYRSEVFAVNTAQAAVAKAYIKQLDQAHIFTAPIATRIAVGRQFFPAESYHQDFAEKHPDNLYLRINDAPKVAALKARFSGRYQTDNVAVANRGSDESS